MKRLLRILFSCWLRNAHRDEWRAGTNVCRDCGGTESP